MPSIYETLTDAVKLAPEAGEAEQVFLARLVKAINKLEEDDFDKLPEPAQDWFNDAALAVQHEKPIQKLPGLDMPADDENKSDPEPEPEPEPAPRPRRGAKASTEKKATEPEKAAAEPAPAAAKEAKGSKGSKTKEPAAKKDAAKKKADTPAAAKPAKSNGARGIGILDHLLDTVHDHPDWAPAKLAEHVAEKHKINCPIATATGIKQQYRRLGRFFVRKGLLKDGVELDVGG